MGKKLVLGYTRAGYPVLLPARQTPDMSQFVSWTPGDHLDASRILMEHGERESDPIGSWCAHWAGAHWAIGKSARRKKQRQPRIRGAAEIRIGRKR
jgi:hypothetical protein